LIRQIKHIALRSSTGHLIGGEALCWFCLAAFTATFVVGLGVAWFYCGISLPAILAVLAVIWVLFALSAIALPMPECYRRSLDLLVHKTHEANLDGGILQPNGHVHIAASRGRQKNLLNLHVGESAFFFQGSQFGWKRLANLCGRESDTEAIIHIDPREIPTRIYFRLIDGTIIVPRGYKGPASKIERPSHTATPPMQPSGADEVAAMVTSSTK
jgi:hypothetical protein